MSRTIEDIERYVLDQMTDSERLAFNADLQADEILRQEVEKYHLIMEASELAVEDNLRQKLSQLANVDRPAIKPSINWRKYLAVAAGVAILLSLGIWLSISNSTSAVQYAEQTYFNYEAIKLRSDNAPMGWDVGLAHIRNKRWTAAADYFKKYIADNPADLEAAFLLGDIYYRSDNYAAAMAQWQTIIDQDPTRWTERAQWNYACAAVANGSLDQATAMLNRISTDQSHSFYTQAGELANRIE